MRHSYLRSHTGLSSCIMIIQTDIIPGNKGGITKLLFILFPLWSPSVVLAENPWDCRCHKHSRLKHHATKDIRFASRGIEKHIWQALCQYLINIQTLALHKHVISNYYKPKEYLRPQTHKTFIICSIFFGSVRTRASGKLLLLLCGMIKR